MTYRPPKRFMTTSTNDRSLRHVRLLMHGIKAQLHKWSFGACRFVLRQNKKLSMPRAFSFDSDSLLQPQVLTNVFWQQVAFAGAPSSRQCARVAEGQTRDHLTHT